MTINLYRGRLAPSPTGYLHLGHAYTFWTAQERAERRNGRLILRNEDLDQQRCKSGFVEALVEDLNWLGIDWHEGLARTGEHGPYSQSQRLLAYEMAFAELRARNLVYACTCTRQDVLRALSAPHDGNDEPAYPGTCRTGTPRNLSNVNWRFRLPLGTDVQFVDNHFGAQTYTSGKHFGDFVVWRQDNWPSYQLAVVVDDAAMQITEVVRGSDLLVSTARQILLYRALDLPIPQFYHTPILCDDNGVRLSKRHHSVAIRTFKQRGISADELRSWWHRDKEVLPVVNLKA